jgi:uncharacterized protein (TIGR04551 family)
MSVRLSIAGLLLLLATTARATGFTDIGQDLVPTETPRLVVDGAFRLRTEALDNLDLDRGPTPSGELFFPVPLSSPQGQWLTGADLRLRADLAVYAPGGTVAVKSRIDLLDDLQAGSLPEGIPAATSSQRTPTPSLRLRRAWGEALLPFGLLAAGRMGNTWGMGMLANGGDCADCDSGDSADRIALVTPLVGHLFAAAYDFSASGPLATRRDGVRSLDVDPSVAVRTVTFAALRWHDAASLLRRRKAGLGTVDYGAYVSHRRQDRDLPSSYLPVARPPAVDASQVVERGYTATAIDGWLRLTFPSFHVEAEAAVLLAHVEHASVLPGVELSSAVDSRQIGAALESELGAPEDALGVGLDLGFASGDPAPGFGAFPRPGAAAPRPGDLDGPQANPPDDNRVDNFRFHPDYRIDRILFREIIGTVTDAMYLRPHVRYRIAQWNGQALVAQLALVASRAVEANSTPGGATPLGVELDPTLGYGGTDGFNATLEHAVLFPLSGLDNVELGLKARPAQLIRLRLTYVF